MSTDLTMQAMLLRFLSALEAAKLELCLRNNWSTVAKISEDLFMTVWGNGDYELSPGFRSEL